MNKNLNDEENLHDDDAELDLDALESQLEADLAEQEADLQQLKDEHEKIGTPESLGDRVMGVVWEQFQNQIAVVAGEDFIKENRGLTFDPRDSAHIPTAEAFERGEIPTHLDNAEVKGQLQHNLDRFQNTPHGVFRDKFVDKGMNETLPRAGALYANGQETVRDIYTGRQIPTRTKMEDGTNNPLAAQREHVIPSADLYKDPTLQMGSTDQELAGTINNPNNLQGYTTALRNNRKSDNVHDEMDAVDRNKHWGKANKQAEEFFEGKKEEIREHNEQVGRQSQLNEISRAAKTAGKAALLGLLADLLKNIVQKFVAWLRSGEKSVGTFLESVKEGIKAFVRKLKESILRAAENALTTIATAIFGPIVRLFKKLWVLLKQGWRSLKEAWAYIRNPANKHKPFSIMLMEVSKILVAGIVAGGAIVLGEVIEKGLMVIRVLPLRFRCLVAWQAYWASSLVLS